ncbi:MAG: hypothetical protein LBD59_06045 [Prevotellaceae bacterium]|jgi:hypothetical protein|nr:hypothetical protein [Prevotellaceae bacterium]
MKKVKIILVVTILFGTLACSNEGTLNNLEVTENSEVEFTNAELDVLYRLRNPNNTLALFVRLKQKFL